MEPENFDTPKVSFTDQEFKRPAQFSQSESSKIIKWVTSYSGGFIKDEKQANYVLLFFICIVILVSISLYFYSQSGNQKLSPKDILLEEKLGMQKENRI